LSTVFLFGAGASYGSGDCTPSPPPLGPSLFSELRKRGGVAATVDSTLAATFEERTFEEGMAEFQKQRPAEVLAFQLEMARYFAQFEPGPNCLYRKLVRLLLSTRTRFSFATLNYDLLIELAANAEGCGIGYPAIQHAAGTVPVFKLHGSVNFWTDIPAQMFSNIGIGVGPGRPAIAGPGIRVLTAAEAIARCDTENSICPVMAIYVKDKWVPISPDALKPHARLWCSPLSAARYVYVIGVRVNQDDRHIWEPLASCKGELFYAGRERDGQEFLKWAEKNRKHRRKHHYFAESFDEAVTIYSRKLSM